MIVSYRHVYEVVVEMANDLCVFGGGKEDYTYSA